MQNSELKQALALEDDYFLIREAVSIDIVRHA